MVLLRAHTKMEGRTVRDTYLGTYLSHKKTPFPTKTDRGLRIGLL